MTWVITRHILFGRLLYSVFFDARNVLGYRCFPLPDSDREMCFTQRLHLTCFFLLCALQVIICLWFVMIVNVAWNFVRGGEADDTRSDDENDGEEEEEEEEEDWAEHKPSNGHLLKEIPVS